MQATNLQRIKRQTTQLWLRNTPILLLAFGLSGVIAIAAKSPLCSNLELGTFGEILPWILRLKSINIILAACGIFYMFAGIALYFSGHKLMLRETQRKVFQPFLAPTLFLVAGYLLGIAAPLLEHVEFGWPLAMSISILLLATIVANIFEIFET